MSVDAFPLQWPEGYPRTKRRQQSRFNTRFVQARDGLVEELERMNARHVVVSTNIPIKQDGLPYANQKAPDDPGVAVYFYWRGRQHVLACDQWASVAENLQALRKSVEAMRGLDRWGASGILERAFEGFQRLDAPSNDWRDLLGLHPDAGLDEARSAYRRLRREHHPDHGGDPDKFRSVQWAWDAAQREFGERA